MVSQSQLPRVFADFNNSDRQGRVRLNTVGTIQDLSRLGIVLREGTGMILCNTELEAEGASAYSNEEGLWVAVIDWNKIRELPGDRVS